MKNQILTLIIGILIGAIIATGVFLILQNNLQNSEDENMNMEFNMEDMEDMGERTFKNKTDSDSTEDTIESESEAE